ncbi:MAG: hypothetical protein OWQ57_11295 [Sulfobacillus sp.]|nr:hypothetical protein [Sulfobacillus sp.]
MMIEGGGQALMYCEHCGAKVVDGGQLCTECGLPPSAGHAAERAMAKVIPFRPRKKTPPARPPKRKRRPSATTWWIIAIVAASLIIPYLWPLGH